MVNESMLVLGLCEAREVQRLFVVRINNVWFLKCDPYVFNMRCTLLVQM